MAFGARSTADEVLADQDLRGRVIAITGANAGIGFETARALAAKGAQVVLGCRSPAKAEETAARIRALHPQATLHPLALELSSFEAIRAAAASFPAQRLDVLVCNAGLYGGGYHETADGIERVVGVCHFGHALLVHQLLPRLLAAAPSRVVMVSSESHRSPRRLRFDRFPLERRHHRDLVAYGQAKLCNVLFAKELDRRYRERGITTSALHPGSLIATSIDRASLLAKLAMRLARPFTKSLAQGAATSVYCAVRPELEGRGGNYYVDCQERSASQEACDPEVARRLWELTRERLGVEWP